MTETTDESTSPIEMDTEEIEERQRPDFNRFVAIDIETTGLDPKKSDIIELGAIRYINGEESESYHAILKPVGVYPERNRRLTGIDPELLDNGEDPALALDSFRDFISSDLLIAHNSEFDSGFLAHNFEKHNLGGFENQTLCTLHLSALVNPEEESLQLVSISRLWGVNIVDPHRALMDARLAGELYLKLIDDIKTWDPDFINHLAGYRGKSESTIFDLMDFLVENNEDLNPNWRLDKAIGAARHDQRELVPVSLHQATDCDSCPGMDSDPLVFNNIVEAYKRGKGVTLVEDTRPGARLASCSVFKKIPGVEKVLLAVPDESALKEIIGPYCWSDGRDGPDGAVYLGRRSEYICIWKVFDDSGKPAGWQQLSPYERIVFARWLAGTPTGRVARINWWILNNFTGLKGHLAALTTQFAGCAGCEIEHVIPCFSEHAINRANKTGKVIVNHHHLFSDYASCLFSDTMECNFQICVIDGAEKLPDGVNLAAERSVEIDQLLKKANSIKPPGITEIDQEIERVKDALSGLLDTSRRTLSEYRKRKQSSSAGPVPLDDETWSADTFQELATALDSTTEFLEKAGQRLAEFDNGLVRIKSFGLVLKDSAEILRSIRSSKGGWSASIEGAPVRDPRRVTIKLIPIEVSDAVSNLVDKIDCALIAFGRRLKYRGSFDLFRTRLGFSPGIKIVENALADPAEVHPTLFIPDNLNPPVGRTNRKYHWLKYMERTANLLKTLTETLDGCTVAVFSAHHELRMVRQLIGDNPPSGPIVLAQYHDGTKSALIREYISNTNTLLLGGRNLLDGVDLRQAGFTALVVVKLPFPSPEDPYHRAMLQSAESQGLDGMEAHIIPFAVDVTNQWIESLTAGPIPEGGNAGVPAGVVVLLDPRAITSVWGESFLSGLITQPAHKLPFRDMLTEVKTLKDNL